jgi:hypothetical protein
MAVMTGVDLNASLTGIVSDIRVKSYKYLGHEGVFKKLVTPVGVGKNGSSVTEPYFDPTGLSTTTASEGVDFTGFTKYLPTTRSYTATESIWGSRLTYDNVDESTESYRDEQARAHGYVHGKNMEARCAAVCASFTSQITATATAGLGIHALAVAKATLEKKAQSFSGPYTAVFGPSGGLQLFDNLTNVSNVGTLGSLGDAVLDKYHINTVLSDINIFQSNGFAVTATLYNIGGLFIKEAIGLFVPRDYTFKTQEDISARGWEVVSTMKFGARVRLAAAGVGIKIREAVV